MQLSCLVNTVAADVLTTQGAAMLHVVTEFSWNILFSTPEGLKKLK